jgi:hypothetical protein
VSRRKKTLLIVAVFLVLALGWYRLRDGAPPAPPVQRRSAWTVPRLRPHQPPPVGSPASLSTPQPAQLLQVHAVDVTGGPVPGARVAAEQEPDRVLGTTGALGTVEIPLARAGLSRAGWLIVSADGYGHRQAAYLAGSPVLVKLLPETRVAGVVVEASTGAPLPDLAVLCGRQRTSTDPQGRFTCGDLRPGPLLVEAYGRGYHGVLPRPLTLSIATVILDVRLEVARVAFAARGRVTAAGAPVARAEVGVGDRRAVSDEAGRYLVADLPAGSYPVSVQTGVLGVDQPRPLVISDRDVEHDLEIGTRTDLRVEVVDGSGRPVEGQEVWVQQTLDGATVGSDVTTDAAGRVHFEGLLPTEATLSGPRLPTATVDLRAPRARPIRLRTEESGRLEGEVRAPSGTSGAGRRVCAARNGDSPRCEDTGPAGTFAFAALAPGHYRLELRSGRVWNSAQPAEAIAEADVRAGATTEVMLNVTADDAELAGRVLDAAGRPVDDALVIYFLKNVRSYSAGSQALGGGLDVAVTSADGRFRFTRVRPRLEYEVEALTRQGRRGQSPGPTDREIVIRLAD